MSMIVSSIAAVAENGAIGKDNDLIWDLPDDMRFFMTTTKGHHVIMGRRNYESIPHQYRPLKGRVNVVVTRSDNYDAEGAIIVNSIEEGIALARKAGEEEVFVIGGGQIYDLALQKGLVDKQYITHVHASFEADTFYPAFDLKEWKSKVISEHQADERHPHSFTIVEYSRRSKEEA